MVIPSALPGAKSSRMQSVHSERATQSNKKSSSSSSKKSKRYDESREAHEGDHKDETWYNYFFGAKDDARQQMQHSSERSREHSHQQESRDEAAEDLDMVERRRASVDQIRAQQRQKRQQMQDENMFPSWLSWLDPSGGNVCAEQQQNSRQMPHEKDVSVHSYSTHTADSSSNGGKVEQEVHTAKSGATNSSRQIPIVRGKASNTVATDPDEGGATTKQRRLLDPPAERNDNASVDSSVEESKLFHDLESVPSTKVGTIAGSIKTSDFDLNDGQSTVATVSNSVVDNKMQHFKMPRSKKSIAPSTATSQRKRAESEKSIEARRQILVKELRATISTHGRYDVKTANISAALGDLLDESKQYDQSIKLHRDAVEIYSSKLGDDHPTTMEAKLQLAKVLENADKHDEAINIYFLVTVMRKATIGEKDPSAADSLVLMAHALRKKDDYHQAIKELKRALKIYREALGDAHNKVSITVDEIASLYVTIGDFEKSAAILEEVVKLKAVTQGMQSKAVAATLCSLATTYECSEDFPKAMKSLKKAYKIYSEKDGYSSKDATNTLNRIAQLYEATGDYDRASIAYLGVLRGRKIIYGDDHLLVAETYYKLGHALREGGQNEKALKCLKEGLPIFVNKGVEINDVEMIAEVMHEMALINKERKRFNEAAKIFKQELGVRRKIGQAEYPMIARTLNHLGVTEYEMKNNNKSLKYLIEALTIFKDRAEGTVECAEVLFNTGLVFESSRNRERAMEAYDESARIFKEHGYKESHPHLAKAIRKIEKLQTQTSKNGGLAQKL